MIREIILQRKTIFLLSLISFYSVNLKAQPHPILENFYGFLSIDNIVLKWTIISGSTCNGIKIYRSDDTVSFSQIGSISGVCGNITSPVPYDFTDKNPIPNKTNYYKLELGSQGFSETIAIEYIRLSGENYLIKGNPVIQESVIYFPNESHLPMSFSLFNLSGKMIMKKEKITTNYFIFNRQGLNSGLYIFKIENKGETKINGKLIIQ